MKLPSLSNVYKSVSMIGNRSNARAPGVYYMHCPSCNTVMQELIWVKSERASGTEVESWTALAAALTLSPSAALWRWTSELICESAKTRNFKSHLYCCSWWLILLLLRSYVMQSAIKMNARDLRPSKKVVIFAFHCGFEPSVSLVSKTA